MTKVTAPSAVAGRIEGLRRVSWLAAVDASDLETLAGRSAVRVVARGAAVFEEGAPAEALHVVLAGRVKVVRASPAGREQALHVEGAGAALGEVPVFDGGGYVATAVALEEARVLAVPRVALLELCARRPAVALGVIAALARRVRAFAALVEDLALRDVTARVAGFLAAEARRTRGDTFVLPGTRDELAARLGTVRERVSRSLSSLQAAGAVRVRGRTVWVVDRGALLAVAARPVDRARGHGAAIRPPSAAPPAATPRHPRRAPSRSGSRAAVASPPDRRTSPRRVTRSRR